MAPDDTPMDSAQQRTTNFAGGGAWSQAAEQELTSLVLTSFVQDQFYRTADETVHRVRGLVRVVDPGFVARLALLARREFQLRSISHVLACELAEVVKGAAWARCVYRDLVVRADDVTAILAWRRDLYGLRPLPNSLKRGLADALRLQSAYALAKYASGTDGVRMVDAVNLCRPRPTSALSDLVNGTLEAPDTWEVALTRAGRAATSAEDLRELKAAEWDRLVTEDRLGYMALLRNLRNIATYCSPRVRQLAADRIADPARVRASRQLPFRFASALRALEWQSVSLDKLRGPDAWSLRAAVTRAMDVALGNVPVLPGTTLVAVDTSASMLNDGWMPRRSGSAGTSRSPIETATLFAAALARKSAADVLLFDTRVQWFTVDQGQSVADIDAAIQARVTGGGTDFHLVFEHARRAYDRIVILSDMQAWVPRYDRYCLPELPEPGDAVTCDDGMDDLDAVEEQRAGEVEAWFLADDAASAAAALDPDVLDLDLVIDLDFDFGPEPELVPVPMPAHWREPRDVKESLSDYRRRTGADPVIFCFDLQGYGTSQFVDGRVIQLAGFSEKLFDLMPLFEQGEDAMVRAVRGVDLPGV